MSTKHVHIHNSFISGALDPALQSEVDHEFRLWTKRFSLPSGKLLTVSTEGLWETYLRGFSSPALRQYHNCNECRRFIERFGGIVTVGEKGTVHSALWYRGTVTGHYALANDLMADLVAGRKVTGVVISDKLMLGIPVTGVWEHFAVLNPTVADTRVKTCDQQEAEKLEEFRIVSRALERWTLETMSSAVALLAGDHLYRNDKILPQAKWLRDLKAAVKAGNRRQSNIVWKAVADAPAGFCHPTSGVLGTLLDDIASGEPMDDIVRRFREKMNPLQYQRPQARPAAQTVKQAEALFEKLGLAPALERRYLLRHEVPTFWTPRKQAPAAPGSLTPGIFSSVPTKTQTKVGTRRAPVEVPGKTNITWVRFLRDVVPVAESMQLLVGQRDAFVGLATARHPDAPPLFHWDLPEKRNPASWWFRAGGVSRPDVGLSAQDKYIDVVGLARHIHEWTTGSPLGSSSPGVLFILKDARSVPSMRDIAIFPECVRSELHGVRSVIEAYSKTRCLTGSSNVGGVLWTKNAPESREVRVTVGNLVTTYVIDRWD